MSSNVMWRRLRYMLTPQLDLYTSIARQLSGQRVLDIGFGTGMGTLQLTRRAASVMGIENDPDAVLFAQTCLPGVDWCEGDVLRLNPFLTGGTFDVVVMVEVLEHIKNWKMALVNIHLLLNPGGRLYLTARNAAANLRRNDIHEREVTGTQLVEMLAGVFSRVRLFDYTLEHELALDTHVTPLIAVAER